MRPVSEEWRIISEFPSHEVSSWGRVRRATPGRATHVGRLRKLSATPDGHLYTSLYGAGRSQRRHVHALVCAAFNGPKPSAAHEVAHNDGEPANNWPSNLRWATHRENIADIFRHGTRQNTAGECSAMAKLTEAQVREIFSRARGGYLQSAIGKDFGVSRQCVGAIARGVNWSHLGLVAQMRNVSSGPVAAAAE